jgi:hypothetical protein
MSANINKAMEMGILPDSLNYGCGFKVNDSTVDWSKVQYNTFYKTPEYFEKRFHPCLKNLPGFDTVLESIVEQNADNSLTKEMLERGEIKNVNE